MKRVPFGLTPIAFRLPCRDLGVQTGLQRERVGDGRRVEHHPKEGLQQLADEAEQRVR